MYRSDLLDAKEILSPGHIETTDYGGVRPFEALKNIKKRCQERKEKRYSRIKTALVLQGGGMRGVFGAGVCCALQELGYTEGFDEVYGVSAGALNGAYFLSGQAAYGTTIYYQNINNRNFIDFFRFKRIIDIDFLIDIITKVKPLNVEKLLKSSTHLNILLTQISTGKAVMFKIGSGDTDIIKILKATAAMPFAYDIPVNIQGVDYLDGGVSCPVPITEAIEEGCTDILAVLTRPKDYKPSSSLKKIFGRPFIESKIKKHGKNFYKTFIERHKVYKEKLSIIMGKSFFKKEVNILAIFPGKSLKIKRTTKKEDVLKNAAIEGAVKVLRLFSHFPYHPVEVLKFLNY